VLLKMLLVSIYFDPIYYFLTKHMSSAAVHMTTAVPAYISRWLTKPHQFSASISCW